MLHRINKAHPLTWVTPSTVQIGIGETSIQISDLTLPQQQILEALYSGIVDGQQTSIDDALRAPKGQTNTLLHLLSPVIENHISPEKQTWESLAFAELARTSLDYQVNGEMVLAERWQRKVHLDQLDATGLLLAKGLIAAGVGKVLTHDDGVVLNTDLGELGYPKEFLGTPRKLAANEVLKQLSGLPESRLVVLTSTTKTDHKISFAIVVGHLALVPKTYSRWTNRDVNHLGIIFGLDKAEVSPVVIPGTTPCLNCYQEKQVDQDENWPVIASQLVGLPRIRDDVSARLTTTGLALRSVLRNLDEQAGFLMTKTDSEKYSDAYIIDYASGNISRNQFEFHQLCTCSGIS